ncbi:hypothetical protein B7494_g5106 [Chlorociboria aeruginascens]|nr:hypothetical protein B7494_g5106 [Chlorociboria aeruginascens]
MPRKDWDLLELRLAGALDTGPTRPPDLSGQLHDLFSRERWEVSDDDYEVLLPSMHLASNLLRVGMPYIATFLPSDYVYNLKAAELARGESDITGKESLRPSVIPLKRRIRLRDLKEAEYELKEVAKHVTWQTDEHILERVGWLGVTLLAPVAKPLTPVGPGEIADGDADAKRSGKTRRPLLIGLCQQYVTAIRNSEEESEQHLRATFMVGVTMAHEIGHVILHQDFRSYHEDGEPYVGNDCINELGSSFIGWIFSGYNPSTSGGKIIDYKQALCWDPQLTTSLGPRPLYKTYYALPIKYIQDVLSQSFWTHLDSSTEFQYSSKARGALKPTLPNEATANLPEWKLNFMLGKITWKHQHRLSGVSVFGVSDEEWLEERAIEIARLRRSPSTLYSDKQISQFALQRFRSPREPGADLELDLDDDDDDIEDFLDNVPKSISNDDGTLQQNVGDYKDSSSQFIEIVVWYDPSTDQGIKTASSKRSRSEDDIKEETDTKRQKTNVAAYIRDVHPTTLQITRLEASNYLTTKGLRQPMIKPETSWKEEVLNPDDANDLTLLYKIYEYLLRDLERIHTEDTAAILKIREARVAAVSSWSYADTCEFLESYPDLDLTKTTMSIEAVRSIARNKLDSQLSAAQEADSISRYGLGYVDDEPVDWWSDADLRSFCRGTNLPVWGTRNALIARVERYQNPAARLIDTHRANDDGLEKYTFNARLKSTSVISLKSSLYIVGHFLPDAVLHLTFGHSPNELQDGETLGNYKGRDWNNLVLKILYPIADTPSPAKNIAIPPVPPKMPSAASVRRAKAIEHALSADTLAKRVELWADHATALERIATRPGLVPGAPPPRHPYPLNVVDMLDDLIDLDHNEKAITEDVKLLRQGEHFNVHNEEEGEEEEEDDDDDEDIKLEDQGNPLAPTHAAEVVFKYHAYNRNKKVL